MKHVNVRLDDETHAMLIAQAETNLRSANAQITWLIRQEDAAARASYPMTETAPPPTATRELPAEPEVFVNDYQVTRFPRDHGGARHFSLWVQYRGAGKWAVTRYRDMSPFMTYDPDGIEDYDSGPFDPDSDEDGYEKNRAWRERRRWDSAEAAIVFAKTLLPGLRCNGRTAEDVMRREVAS